MPERRLSRELRIVFDLARAVGSAAYDVGQLMDRICSEVRNVFGFERALMVRLDPERRTVHAFVRHGLEWPGDEWLLLDKFPFLTRAFETGHAVFVRDAREERAVPAALVERFQVHSIVAVPMTVEGECLGFIVGDRREGGGEFDLTEDELAFLTALGSIAAVFIAKADQYAELQGALDELQQLDRAKSDFVSIASHELRTPISVIHGMASTLYERGPDLDLDQVLQLRETLHFQTVRLRDLAERLLDLSRLDAGAVPLTSARFRPRERIEALVPEIAPERLGDIEIEVEQDLEVTSDPDAFERIMANLIVNAVRYGRPPIRIGSEVNARVRLLVEDRGDGIDPEFVPNLFERFTRSEKARELKKEGAGLGLAIAQAYARSLGGDLLYEPLEPAGSRFTLELPKA
jgi:signal transduction histidine kinase